MTLKADYRSLLILVVLAITIVVFVGCPVDEDDSVSIDERIDSFMSDVNAGRFGELQKHIHPDADQYQQSASADTWSPSPFSSGQTYTLGTKTRTDNTVTTTMTGGVFNEETTTFGMKEDGSKVWKIRSLTIGSSFTLSSVE